MAKLKKVSKPKKDQSQKRPEKVAKAIAKPKKVQKQIKVKNNETKLLEAEAVFVKISEDSGKKTVKNVNPNYVRSGVKAVLAYHQKFSTKKLLEDEYPVFLQITCIKIPRCPSRQVRMSLKHSLVTENSEICLFVPDLERGRKKDHDPTIAHYEELLNSKAVTNIKRIMPMHEVKTEYDQFELKRRLVGLYDFFLVDGRISGHLCHLLGDIFVNKRKQPIPIHIAGVPNLKETVNSALLKAQLHLHCKGNSYIVQVGHSNMTPEMIAENVESVVDGLSKNFPGGWENIRSLHVKTSTSLAVPVYLTLKSGNRVPVPTQKTPRPKLYKEVGGELSTFQNADVRVHPSGFITLNQKIQKPEEEEGEKEEGISDDEGLVPQTPASDEENMSDDEDNIVANAEEAYMAGLKVNRKSLKMKSK